MPTPEPSTGQSMGAEENGDGNGTGTEPDTSQETNRESGTPNPETDGEQATSEEKGRQAYIAGELGTTSLETDKKHATNLKSGTSKVMAGEPGTTTQGTNGEQTSTQESGTTKVTAGEPGTPNQGTDGEQASTQESGREPDNTEVSAGEPGTPTQGTDGEQASNQESGREPDNTEVTAGEPGTTDQETEREPDTSETIDVEEGVEEGRIDIGQENTSTEQQKKEELASTEPSPDGADLDMTPEEEELKVTNGADIKSTGASRYQETPIEHPGEQEDTQYRLDTQENEETKTQEEYEQWGQDIELQDSSGDTTEDEQVREALIQQYNALVSEKEKVQQQNSQLQHKLYEYFRRKKGEETRPEVEKRVSDQEQRYLKYLATLEEMRKKFKVDAVLHEQQIEELMGQCQQVESQVDKEWATFQEQRKKIASYVVNRGAGKHAASSFAQEVVQLQAKEERKEKEVIQVRLENIKLKNQIHRHESAMRSKEELAEGLHLIDFEQLKIENQTYNEKIEERNEELLKLRKKITNTVQVLTHLKEKLQFVQAENQEQKDGLMEIDALVARKRDILTRTKQARDSLRMDNLNLKQKCGLLGNKTLLRDFEEKVDATEELSQKLESLKRRHAERTLSSKGVMKKIQDTKLVIES